jgi:hypothetical protein
VQQRMLLHSLMETDMTTFPALESLARSPESNEPINGGSIAINRILNRLRDTAGSGIGWKMWLINFYTILDSVFDIDMTKDEVEHAVAQDVDLLTRYISAYVSYYPQEKRSAAIVVYLPTYQAVPERLCRVPKDQTKGGQRRIAMDKMYAKIRASYTNTPSTAVSYDYGQTMIHIVKVGDAGLPHLALARYVRTLPVGRDIRYRPTVDPTALISHCPLDMHIRNDLRNVRLLERHTGAVIPLTELHKRIHRSLTIPFTPHTHQAFGDSVHLKGILAPAERKAVVKAAEDNSWLRMTDETILVQLAKVSGRERNEFGRLNL